MVWQKDIDELRYRLELARQMGGAEGIAKQRAKGRLTVRERINLLFDPGSFQELHTLEGKSKYDDKGNLTSFTPLGRVVGYGLINDRRASVVGDDFTISGTGAEGVKRNIASKLSIEWRIPHIRLVDSPGGAIGRDEGSMPAASHDEFGLAILETLMLQVPVVSAVLGTAAGWPAVRVAQAHWSIMTKNAELFVAGPPLVSRALNYDITKQELGGYKVHAYQSGVVDNVAEDEEDAFRQIRRFLSYLPNNVWQQPPRVETGDDPNRRDEELLSIIPRDRRKHYNIRQLIKHIIDKDSMFEFSPFYGRSAVTLLARMDGYPAAVVSSDSMFLGGALDGAAAEKMTRFVDLADTFHIPIIYLIDVAGFMIGLESEKGGTLRKAARAQAAIEQATVPEIGVRVRRSFGVGGAVQGSRGRLNLHYAWPSARWGVMPIEGGVAAVFKREIEAAPDPEAKRIEIEERLEQLSSPFRAAERGSMEEIIDPRDTRPLLCEFVRHAQEITATQLGPKFRGIRP